MLAEAEAAIVKRVEAILAPFEVSIAPFPGDSDAQTKPGRKGQIFIGYKRSRFRPTSFQPMTCEIIAEFELSLQLRDLRTHRGAYPLLDTVRYAVTGLIPLKGPLSKCYPVQEGFVKTEDGIWYYALVVAVAMMQIEGQQPYTAADIDYLERDPALGVRPYNATQIQVAVRRSRVDELPDNVVDRTFTVIETVPTGLMDFSSTEAGQYIEIL
ncbi:Gp37 family protein [Nostoc sp. CHAB 5824]|nr:Gp37 family protein [Nostoc sp. CHAB 5824]